jgi:hypothetical protein
MACSCGKVFPMSLGLEATAKQESVYDVDVPPATIPARREPRKKPIPMRMPEPWREEVALIKDRVVPAAMIVGGILGRSAQLVFAPTQSGSTAGAVALMALDVIANVATVWMGAYVAALLLSVSFGNLTTALLKLAGMAIFSGAAGRWISMVDKNPFSVRGLLIGLQVAILIYFTSLAALFEVDLQEALMATVIIGAMQGLVMMGLHAMG